MDNQIRFKETEPDGGIRYEVGPSKNEVTSKTSRGYALEMIELIGNLLAATEHIHDIPDQNEVTIDTIRGLRNVRQTAIDVLVPTENANMDYHCAFKHLALAYIMAKETLQTAISIGDIHKMTLHQYLLESVKSQLLNVASLYFRVEEENGLGCMKCIEDRVGIK